MPKFISDPVQKTPIMTGRNAQKTFPILTPKKYPTLTWALAHCQISGGEPDRLRGDDEGRLRGDDEGRSGISRPTTTGRNLNLSS